MRTLRNAAGEERLAGARGRSNWSSWSCAERQA
jgi:hypothetical protein